MPRFMETNFNYAELDEIDSESIFLNERPTVLPKPIVQGVVLSWQKRTKLEKCLIITIGVLAATFVIFLLYHRSSDNKSEPSLKEHGPCLKAPCIHAASKVIDSIDQTINPCTDFYAFACNRWIKDNPLSDEKSKWDIFDEMLAQNQLVIKNVLERPESMFKSEAEKKAKFYYESCIDVDGNIQKLGAKPMFDLIRNVGGWNVTSNASNKFNVSNWSLEKTLKILSANYNVKGFFYWDVTEDARNSSRNIIGIGAGGLTLLSKEYYLNKTANAKVLSDYLNYMVKVAVILGANKTEATRQMQSVIDFETKIAQITGNTDDNRSSDSQYQPMSLKELQVKAPLIDWCAYFQHIFQIIKRNITENERVIVYAPEYLEKLTSIVQAYNKTEDTKAVLNNYLIWKLVDMYDEYLSKPFGDAQEILRKALYGTDKRIELWRRCMFYTDSSIGFATGAMFVREKFHSEAKSKAVEMINDIRLAFKENLKNLEWIDPETRILMNEKSDVISNLTGYPDYIRNTQLLDNQYEALNINRNKYFDNNVNLNVFNLKNDLKKLDEPVSKTKWDITPSTVGLEYLDERIQLQLPAGILRPPFFYTNSLKSLNFGAIGVLIGDELTHAFDDEGRYFDKHGNLHQWWNKKTIENYKERVKCFTKQYSQYKINGTHLNGKRTLVEDIADNGGLKASYNAYINSNNVDEMDIYPLPGTNITHRQLFFISFAQIWCGVSTDEAAKWIIQKEDHSVNRFRVIGTLSNSKEFSEAFNCSIGSPMNPRDKCELW